MVFNQQVQRLKARQIYAVEQSMFIITTADAFL